MSDFKLLAQRDIIDILIGDTVVLEKDDKQFRLPYLSGPMLCAISTKFGLECTYAWSGGGKSRWQYLKDLIEYLDQRDGVDELLKELFDFRKFNQILNDYKDREEIKRCYLEIIESVISTINAQLFYSHKELLSINNRFVVSDVGKPITVPTENITSINVEYIRGLVGRVEEDLCSKQFDSVVTKSRTLVEEVIIYILEQRGTNVPTSGNLLELYRECKETLGMIQDKSWDKRILEMLSGLEKIVNAISGMRNTNSDAHGVGSARIDIKEREARLIVNASVTMCEYILDVYESQK
ncbi:MAG: abortive infection family protein [Muribaculaceae bacterium]|nr:abortive infection family protein [Muribaculaceae bacterium]